MKARAHSRLKNLLSVLALCAISSAMISCSRSSPATESGSGSGGAGEVDADFHTLKTPLLAAHQFELITLSTLPDTVSDGDVLLAVRGLDAADTVRVKRNGTDVSSVFTRQSNGDWNGLVSGLKKGANTLSATATGPSGTRNASLVVRNHPITGPIISGPHQKPFICETKEAGLGDPIDDNCSVKTVYQWFYRSSLTQGFNELADPYAAYPADAMTTVTKDGAAVPFVVRVESATINRGIARISVLDDPHARGRDKPFAPTWNHRVYYAYGESCGTGYHQGINDPTIVMAGLPDPSNIDTNRILINLVGIDQRLGKGDVIVHSTASAYGVNCNPMLSIETAMMIKEHITEQYGLIDDVIGTNGSGAALQQYNAINNAPGLLTGAMPTATFADVASTAMTVVDCGLLNHYYSTRSNWTGFKQAAVNGHLITTDALTPDNSPALNSICASWVTAFLDVIDPTKGCASAVPEAMRYNKETKKGVRCTVQDAQVNIWGRDPKTGFARRPMDNIGIQYGLAALNAGTISTDEFIDLNQNIGGFGIDGDYISERMDMGADVAELAHRAGQVIGRGAIAETPVMDLAPYLDLIPVLNIHESIRPFTVRARLRKYTGQDTVPSSGLTQSMWRGVLTQPDAFSAMDKWIAAMHNPTSENRIASVQAARPSDAQDRCVIGTLGGRLELPNALLGPLGIQAPLLPSAGLPGVVIPLRVDVPEEFDTPNSPIGPCQTLLPVPGTPRMAAGMPLTDDVIKCQLKPINASDYPAGITEAQLNKLRTLYPQGVCDYTKSSVGFTEKSMLWPSFGGEKRVEPYGLRWRVARSN
ncbi:DUF6351 family protein [Stenotrophobium rhamnosiphilum]|uniref:DUF6351 domain-containing protein n=1 Tax=Stenotrophobium rhamnosiphilum TaxID=2029166 RepID=A0A2T5MK85_9GAMM|nr:DUF6351 family protein [Stenotrophobium rhamnosiphilum]PTU32997.1 hypothetical protein CJD38_02465 [Stenotrophobium rhamnosiphilum]